MKRWPALPLASGSSAAAVLNAVVFQLGWFACVLGGSTVALVAVPLLLLAHYLCCARDPRRWLALLVCAGVGILVDILLTGLGLFHFEPSGLWIPLWLGALWLMFASTLDAALGWLRGHWLAAAALAAVGGPLSYWAGVQFGAARFGWPTELALGLLVLTWGALFPALLWLHARVRGAQ